jgi:N-carbamoylputrescine amidase
MSGRPATLRVAALQLNSASGDVGGNLARAVPFVEAAAAAGAQLVLLPELYSSGFVFDRTLWDAAERLADGATRVWLCALAARLRIHLGTSVLEARGAHFFNTFMLAQPDGTLAGVVRKQTPAALEAFFFAPGTPAGAHAHVIPCPLLGGLRLGVGICYENAMDYLAHGMIEAQADVLLMPHSACRVEGVPAGVVAAYDAVLTAMPQRYALALRIPVVLANKSGPWTSSFLGEDFAFIRRVGVLTCVLLRAARCGVRGGLSGAEQHRGCGRDGAGAAYG